MKDLMKSNIYDCSDKIIIVGSCLKAMQPKAFEELETMNLPIFELCLEQTHINMAITKLLGMIRARKISKVIFASAKPFGPEDIVVIRKIQLSTKAYFTIKESPY